MTGRIIRIAIPWLLLLLTIQARAETDPVLRIDPGGHTAVVWDVHFTSDGRYVVSSGEDKMIRVWDLESGRTVRTILGQIGPDQYGKFYATALSPDDRYLAAGGYFPVESADDPYGLGAIRLHHFPTGKIEAILRGHTNVVTALCFSSDGKLLASGGADRTVRIWPLDRPGQSSLLLEGHRDLVSGVAFSPDGRRLASSGYEGEIRLWRTSDGALLHRLTGHQGQIWSVAYSPDGRYIASCGVGDLTIKLWDGTDGRFIKNLVRVERHPPKLAFSPDGARLAAAAQEGRGSFAINIYEVATGRKVSGFEGHHNSVKAVALSPDGRLAASAGGNRNEVYVWSADDGRPLRACLGAGAPVWSVGISAAGDEIALGRRYTRNNILQYGPLTQSIRLRDGGEWGVWLGPELSEESRFLRAVDRAGPLSLRVARGGRFGWFADLEILREGRVVQRITRDAATGSEHRCYTFTPDGQAVISGGNNGYLAAYDVNTGRLLARFTGHEAEVWAVAVSGDGRLLVSGSHDQTVRIWNLSGLTHGTGQDRPPLVSIFTGLDREWVAWTPQGYYTSSLKGDRYIGWHVNHGPDQAADFFPAERFAGVFFRSDLVSAVMETGDLRKGFERTALKNKVKRDIRVADLIPPAVVFLQPDARDIETSEPEIEIKALAKSVTGAPITEFVLQHNGRPVVEADTANPDPASRELRLEKTVRLEPGRNLFTITAAGGPARSNPETIHVYYQPREREAVFKPDLYLLAIGVSMYQDDSLNLDLAHIDAATVAEFFETQAGKLYNSVRIRLLTDDRATRGNILDGLDWLLGQATQKDVAVLFLAGHGTNDARGGYYFLGHDVDPQRLRRSAVEWFHFQDILRSIPSKIILLADTCHSGNITGSRFKTRGASDMTEALKELVASDSGVVVITAATGRESSIESLDWGHGAFTLALLDGLAGEADYDKNGMVEIKEIDLYITHRVKELTEGIQHPTTEIPASLPNFPVAVRLE